MVALALFLSCRIEVGPPRSEMRASSTPSGGGDEVWLYTSMYEDVLATMRPIWAERFPHLRVEVFQAGSEKVAQRYEAEVAAGGSRACLLATSDPSWVADLAARGELLPYVPPRALAMDRRWVDPDGHWTTMRVSLMVLASALGDEGPRAFRDLADPQWKDRFSTPDPLASGTALTTWATLEASYGPEWLREVHDNGLVASGGNSSALTRMKSGERPVGFVLLENILLDGSGSVRAIFPEDGAVAVPGTVAIPRQCPNPLAAQELTRWFFTDEAQALIVAGKMHGAVPGVAPPDGVPALDDIRLMAVPARDADGFRARWAATRDAP